MRAIIPCAGYGTRMNMLPNKSKEMLLDKEDWGIGNKGKPLIQYALTICKMFNLEPIVITRKEKTDLRQYLFDNQVEFIDIEVEGEWPQTILKSKDHWNMDNILILPDTRFSSLRCIEDIQKGLKLGNNAVMALHEVPDPNKWGIVEDYLLFEKSKFIYTENQWAWGLIGFKGYYGVELFSNMRDNGFELKDVGFTYLNDFQDITRKR